MAWTDDRPDWTCRYYGLQTDVKAAKEHRAKAEGRLDGYEAILSKTIFLAGNMSATMMGLTRSTHVWLSDGRSSPSLTFSTSPMSPC